MMYSIDISHGHVCNYYGICTLIVNNTRCTHRYLKRQHMYMYVTIMGLTYMYIVLLLLPFFIRVYTSQYR